ncbi:MAG: hypothetical protein J6K32_10360 [Clostridia bacterium]|nr:hypothetical protein [Clostridia bacterium]
MKNNKMSREYNIDYIAGTITVTKKFLKAAGVFGSNEYTLLKQLRADYPDFAFAQKEIAKKNGKQSHKNLTFKKMREHIIIRDGEESERLKRYDYLMEFYKTHAGRYAKIKSWYLEQYKDEYKTEEDTESKVETENNKVLALSR